MLQLLYDRWHIKCICSCSSCWRSWKYVLTKHLNEKWSFPSILYFTILSINLFWYWPQIFPNLDHKSFPILTTDLSQSDYKSFPILNTNLSQSWPQIFPNLDHKSFQILTTNLSQSWPKILPNLYQKSCPIFTKNLAQSLPKILPNL